MTTLRKPRNTVHCSGSGMTAREIFNSINRCPVCQNLVPVFNNWFDVVASHDLTREGRIA